MPGLSAPAVATAGSITSDASTSTDGSTVKLHARTQVNNFNLLGVLTFDSLVTDVSATSDGVKTDVEGSTTISGAAVAGSPVTIDSNGVHGAGGAINQALAAAGITVTLVGPVEQEGETASQVTSAGLRILIDSAPAQPVLGPLADLVPPTDVPGVEDLLALTRVRHLQYIDVGRGFVSLATRGRPLAEPDEPLPTSSDLLPSSAPLGAGGLVGATTPLPAPPAVRGNTTTEQPAAPEPASSTTLASGIGALAVLALLAQPFAGSRLARLATSVLAPGAAGSCPQEER
jgi:hypothetical protein